MPGPETHGSFEGRCKAYIAELALRLLDLGINVILDYGFWKRAERDDARRFFSRAGCSTRLLYFDTSDEAAAENLKERAERLRKTGERGYVIDEKKRIFFDSLFEPPSEEEGFAIALSESDPFLALIQHISRP